MRDIISNPASLLELALDMLTKLTIDAKYFALWQADPSLTVLAHKPHHRYPSFLRRHSRHSIALCPSSISSGSTVRLRKFKSPTFAMLSNTHELYYYIGSLDTPIEIAVDCHVRC